MEIFRNKTKLTDQIKYNAIIIQTIQIETLSKKVYKVYDKRMFVLQHGINIRLDEYTSTHTV